VKVRGRPSSLLIAAGVRSYRIGAVAVSLLLMFARQTSPALPAVVTVSGNLAKVAVTVQSFTAFYPVRSLAPFLSGHPQSPEFC